MVRAAHRASFHAIPIRGTESLGALYIFAHAESQRVAHKFQISQSTVSEIMTSMLPRFESLHKAFVRLPPDDWLDP